MTLEDILKEVQVKLEISADEIDWDDDETKARVTLANSAIISWATAKNTPWLELQRLFETDEIEAGNENEFRLPKDLRNIEQMRWSDGGSEAIKRIGEALATGGCYIEGNARIGRKLKLADSLAVDNPKIGQTLKLVYTAYPKLLKNPEDIPEMTDPSFIVDYVCASVATDDDPSKYSVFSTSYA